MQEILKQADELLLEIKLKSAALINLEAAAAEEMWHVTNKYALLTVSLKKKLANQEKQLHTLMRRRRNKKLVLFADTDRVDLDNGALIHQVEEKVRRAKGMLERLKAHGFHEAVKIAESVDWDKVERFSAERLAKLNTERKKKDIFTYEVKQ